jgi:hydroxyacylglutathione hydrolase
LLTSPFNSSESHGYYPKAGAILTCVVVLLLTSGYKEKETHALLEKQRWIHGDANCANQSDPLIQIVQYNSNTWIFRQNKCVHYEAPFIYLFLGKNKALLVDTGATESEAAFPLYDAVSNLIQGSKKNKKSLPLIVAHTHSHSDHHAADKQFRGKPNIEIVGLRVNDIKKFFGIENWPQGSAKLDLGDRVVEIIPIPGHQESSIAFYDASSELLLTGDTFYPGRLYVDDWKSFKESIARLYDFATHHQVTYIVGNHIEMSLTTGVDYPTGSTYQPEEQRLPLTVEELGELNEGLGKTGGNPERVVFGKFIVTPK